MDLVHDTMTARGLAKPAVPSFLTRALRAIWTGLESLGRARARREVLQLARDVQASRPELAAQLRRTARQSWL
jgi:hypothetical protein